MQNIDLLNFITTVAFGLLSIYNNYLFLNITLKKDESKNTYIAILFLGYFIVSTIFTFLEVEPPINLAFGLVSMFLISQLYKSSNLKRAITSILIMLITMIAELVITYTYSFILNESISSILSNNNIVAISFALSKLIPFVILSIIYFIMLKNKRTIKVDAQISVLTSIQLILIPAISIFLLYAFYEIIEQHNIITNWLIVVILALTLNCVVFFELYRKVLVNAQNNLENILLNKQIEYHLEFYESMAKERKNILETKHNIKNEILAIQASIIENKYDAALKDIDSLLEFSNSDIKVMTNIAVIDTILNYKITMAESFGIKLKTDISIYGEFKLNNSDISNILGNTINNAITAVKEIEREGYKNINLILKQQGKNLYYYCENKYVGEINFCDDLPVSNKRDRLSNGIGLKTVSKILEKYGSEFNIETQNQEFKIEMVIFDAFK